ncbi:hypothetical protein V5O48_002534 [Marasmius crinis-equi]|uniref:C2H2-type domain-containing protein n=1 Tax=Marasmius crinis-equi TaxID=585013 RepID=A0ABR3FVX3_9AGAR
MGRLRRSRVHNARRDVHRATRTRARGKDLDQIQLIDLDPKVLSHLGTMRKNAQKSSFTQNRAALEAQPLDFEKPGLAQHYCVECAKYYESDTALRSHWKSKVHKRRCKQLKEPAYTIEEAERAAGLGREGKRPTMTSVDGDVAM